MSALLGALVALAPVAKSLSDKVMAPDKRDNGIRDTGMGIWPSRGTGYRHGDVIPVSRITQVMAGFDAANSQLSRAKRVVDATLGSLDEMLLKPLVAVSMTVESTTTSAMAPLSAARGSLESALEALAAIDLAMPDAAALKAPIATARAKLDEMVAKTQARAAPFPRRRGARFAVALPRRAPHRRAPAPLPWPQAAIDALSADYKDDLEKIAKMESVARKVDPDFDIPDPADLKKEIEEEVCSALLPPSLTRPARSALSVTSLPFGSASAAALLPVPGLRCVWARCRMWQVAGPLEEKIRAANDAVDQKLTNHGLLYM